jgi:hypothetical protein
MAYTISASQNGKARVGAAAYQGRRIRVSLANVGVSGFTEESTRANWDSVKVASANGYADVTFVVPAGAYNVGTGRFELGGASGAPVNVVFTASGVGFTFDRLYVVVGTSDGSGGWNEETTIEYLGVESPQIVLSPGQVRTYPVSLFIA